MDREVPISFRVLFVIRHTRQSAFHRAMQTWVTCIVVIAVEWVRQSVMTWVCWNVSVSSVVVTWVCVLLYVFNCMYMFVSAYQVMWMCYGMGMSSMCMTVWVWTLFCKDESVHDGLSMSSMCMLLCVSRYRFQRMHQCMRVWVCLICVQWCTYADMHLRACISSR